MKVLDTILLAGAACGSVLDAQSEGWPAYLHDGRRSGVTEEQLALPLHPQWTAACEHRPQPAWPDPAPGSFWQGLETLKPRVTYDAAFQPIAVDDAVWFASSSDDRVYCLDARRGRTRWSRRAQAPVRFAPVIAGERLFLASDDGFVYCLSRDKGILLWKRRLAPKPTLIPGNGRIISAWPVRTGLVVEDGLVYCAVGLFPSQGTWIFALDATSGEVAWKAELPESLSPQGYLLLSPTRLFVPNGRAMPFAFARADGAFQGVFGGPGGAWALVVEDALVSGPGNAGELAMAKTDTRESLASFRGNRMVVKGDTAYLQTDTQLVALDRGKRVAQPDATDAVLWSVATRHPHAMILAGNTLFAGGDDEVGAYSASTGELLWTGPVKGRALGLAVASGRLIVSTDTGHLHAFGEVEVKKPPSRRIPPQPIGQSMPKNFSRLVAIGPLARYVKTLRGTYPGPSGERHELRLPPTVGTHVTGNGYALVLDCVDGELAQDIAWKCRLSTVLVSRSEEDAQRVRQHIGSNRWGGSGYVRVLVWDSDTLPFPDGFANLVVSEASVLTGTSTSDWREMLRVTAPHGGAVLIRDPQNRKNVLADLRAACPDPLSIVEVVPDERSIPDRVPNPGGIQYLVVRGAPTGGGRWTHAYADAANTSCSGDRLAGGELALQWFGAPGPAGMVDRHLRTTPPLFGNGVLFVPGRDRVVAVDAYNGAWLWEQEVEGFTRTGAPYDGGHWAVDESGLFLAAADKCLKLDLQSGRTVRRYSASEQADMPEAHWGWIALVDGILFGSAQKPTAARRDQGRDEIAAQYREHNPHVVSDAVFATGYRTYKSPWIHRVGVVLNTSLTATDDRVFLLRSRTPAAVDDEDGRVPLESFLASDCELVALELETGEPVWTIPFPEDRFRHSLFFACDRGVLVAVGSYNENGRNVYALLAFDAATGALRWRAQHENNRASVGGDHGEQVHRPELPGGLVNPDPRANHLHTGELVDPQETGEPFFLPSRGGCGTISGSEHCLFYRNSNPTMLSLFPGGAPRRITHVSRPGCWINILPAGGLVLLPEASSGCVCAFPLQTSMALRSR